MGNAFKPSISRESSLSGWQGELEGKLGNYLYNMLRDYSGVRKDIFGRLDQASGLTSGPLKELLSGKATGVGDLWRKGVLDPALRSFDRDIEPRIGESFARHGASFGSRRGVATGQALSDLHAGATGELAQMRTTMAESAKNRQLAAIGVPMQQALGQMAGRMGTQNIGVNEILQFLNRQSTALSSTPGWGSQALGLGGTAMGMGAFGQPQAPGASGTGMFSSK